MVLSYGKCREGGVRRSEGEVRNEECAAVRRGREEQSKRTAPSRRDVLEMPFAWLEVAGDFQFKLTLRARAVLP